MYFETLNIRGFGCLRRQVAFASDKLNLAVADNETGKSTLVAALLAAFYGLEDDLRRRSKRPYKRNVTPWTNPEEFGLDLDFTSENRRWRVERDFNSEEVHLIDRDTGRDHAADYHRGKGFYVIGEELIGLPVDEFLKSFYLRQEEILELRESKGLTHYVQGVATALEGGTSSELAIQRLRDARDSYAFPGSRDGLKVENAIKRLQTERENHLQELDKLERGRQDIEPETQRLAQIELDIERLRGERETSIINGDWAEARELRKLIEAQEKLKKEFETLNATAEELKSYQNFPAAKWEQINNLAGRVSELSSSIAKVETRLKDEADQPLSKIETELQAHQSLAGVQESEVREFEVAISRTADRKERRAQAASARDRLAGELQAAGHDREQMSRLSATFSKLTGDEKRFVEGFRATYAEEEVKFRELKTQREWHERERGLIFGRQQKVASTARFFFLLAAVTIFSGGALILLTQGEWLGQVLAGLGVVFGAVGAITRGTASGTDAAALKKLDADLEVTVKDEEEARVRLEKIGRSLTELAGRIGFSGGHHLLSDYIVYAELRERIEPLQNAEKEFARADEEFQAAVQQMGPFFSRAGKELPVPDEAYEAGRALLATFHEVVRLSDESRSLKNKKGELESELSRLRRDFDSNRQICEDILRLGGITKTEPLEEAVSAFKEALEKHRRYEAVASDQLPRIRQELLPDVDITAKRERLEQMMAKFSKATSEPELTHSKEYYRDTADRLAHEADRLREEREAVNRRIVLAYDRYQTHYPTMKRKIEELDEAITRADTFRNEIETSISIMTDISREVYRSWAIALSEETAPFLTALNPRYGELNFKEDLSFTVRDKSVNRVIPSSEAEAILSTGARDEVFLAARLGIACYLARGARGPVPIVLDEPLSAMDDDKFLSGMRFFLESLSTKHQLLVMSCHEERHRWLAEQIPDLFRERVHTIVLGA